VILQSRIPAGVSRSRLFFLRSIWETMTLNVSRRRVAEELLSFMLRALAKTRQKVHAVSACNISRFSPGVYKNVICVYAAGIYQRAYGFCLIYVLRKLPSRRCGVNREAG